MAFPASPDKGEQYTIGDVTWEYDSASNSWKLLDWQNFGGVTVEVFTSSGTWTKPAGADIVHVTAIGSGGGFGTSTSVIGAVGGGGGALTSAFFDASLLNATEAVTVGSSGTSSTFSTLSAGAGYNGDQSYLGLSPGKYPGAGGGGGGSIDGGTFNGATGATSYGGAAGGSGATVTDGLTTGYGGAGGDSPLYSTTTGSLGNFLPIPGGAASENVAATVYGVGDGGAGASNGIVVIKVWYAWA